jgi:uridine kinase
MAQNNNNKPFVIGLVGCVSSGKSSFLNAFAGAYISNSSL